MSGRYGSNEWKIKLLTILGVVLATVIIGVAGFGAYKVIKPKYDEYQEAKVAEEAEGERLRLEEEARLEEERRLEEGARAAEEAAGKAEEMLNDQNMDDTVIDINSGDYIIADSASRYLSYSDVQNMSLQQVNYAKNEIYARRGRKFKSTELQNYFNSKSWYNGTIEPDAFESSMLNSYERANAEFLSDVEHSMNPNGYQPR